MRRGFLAPAALAIAMMFSQSRASVPLSPAGNGHLLVPVFINAKGPFHAVLDTGADASGVYQWFADKATLKPGPSREIGGMTGTVTTPSYLLDSVTLDGHTVRHIPVDSYPNRHDNEAQAVIIGNDFMDGTIAVFDFPCGRVEIWPKPANMNSLLSSHAQEIHGGRVKDGTQLTFPVTIGSTGGIAVLDTGNRQTKLNLQFAKAARLDLQSRSFRDGETIYGANSKGMKSRFGPVGTVRIGSITIPDATAQIMDLPVMHTFGLEGPAMIFGLDLMKDIRLVYDHQARQFWFDRSTSRAQTAVRFGVSTHDH
jgi:predicted aspartyl protease